MAAVQASVLNGAGGGAQGGRGGLCAAELLGPTTAVAYAGRATFSSLRLRAMKGDGYLVQLTVGDTRFSGSVRPLNVSISVPPCRVGEVPRDGGYLCEACDPLTYSLWQDTDPLVDCAYPADGGSDCLPCPLNADCPGGAVLVPASGAWHSAANSTSFVQCPNSQACRDGDADSQAVLQACQDWWYGRPAGYDYQAFVDSVLANNSTAFPDAPGALPNGTYDIYDPDLCVLWGLPYNHPASYMQRQCLEGYAGTLCSTCATVGSTVYAAPAASQPAINLRPRQPPRAAAAATQRPYAQLLLPASPPSTSAPGSPLAPPPQQPNALPGSDQVPAPGPSSSQPPSTDGDHMPSPPPSPRAGGSRKPPKSSQARTHLPNSIAKPDKKDFPVAKKNSRLGGAVGLVLPAAGPPPASVAPGSAAPPGKAPEKAPGTVLLGGEGGRQGSMQRVKSTLTAAWSFASQAAKSVKWASLINIDQTMNLWRQELLVLMIACFILYPAWCQAALQVFGCYMVDSGEGPYSQYHQAAWPHGYWIRNMSQECYSGVHLRLWVPIGAVFVVLVCFGIPLLSFVVMYAHRTELDTVHVAQTYGFLYRRYNAAFYYWQSVMQLQTLLLVVVDVFGRVLPVYQKAVLLQMILVLTMSVNTFVEPTRFPQLEAMEFFSLAVLSITISLGLFFVPQLGHINPIGNTARTAIGALIILINAAALAYFVFVTFSETREGVEHALTRARQGVTRAKQGVRAARVQVKEAVHRYKDELTSLTQSSGNSVRRAMRKSVLPDVAAAAAAVAAQHSRHVINLRWAAAAAAATATVEEPCSEGEAAGGPGAKPGARATGEAEVGVILE
ncbi:hypothetical protein TSOC_006527 [Tetrabaena socialis]|uniref:TRP C-terminal domain-containing protein n=1 Tax=Tetrabaena socialis TaxID=47790 RepID=A0A2J8A3D3_9CHLO|nr:hypothetical protein TSOC_006527 [Tetrabaena socialis]|eukprot:PNH07024.1 hypothetical protein TSOC_006527 [Tetrabaena socialis]